MDDDERRLGGIAQPQQTLTQRRHRACIVLILIVSGVQRVEHDHLGGGLPGRVEKVIQALRGTEQIAARTGVHQQVLVGGGSYGAAHRRQPRNKLRRG